MSSKGGFHPHIGSIIHYRDHIQTTLFITKDYKEALLQMVGIFSLIKTVDYDPKFLDEIENEYEHIIDIKGIKQYSSRIKAKRRKYRQWSRDINMILYDKGYLENSKYDGSGFGLFDDKDDKAEEA